MEYIRWFPHPSNPNVLCGTYSLSDHNLVDCEIEHWVHTIHGDVYDPIELVRTWKNGRASFQRRVRIEGDDIPYMIHSQEEAKRVCERYFNAVEGERKVDV